MHPCDDSDICSSFNDRKGIKIAHFNIRNLLPKRDTFKLWLEDYVLDVITVSETWLTYSIPSSHLKLHEYEISRLDRGTNSQGGGLLTLVRKTEGTICTANTNSILDLIFTNSSCIASSGSIEVNISDHQPSYIVRKHEELSILLLTSDVDPFITTSSLISKWN